MYNVDLSRCPKCNDIDIEEQEDCSGVDLRYRTFKLTCYHCGHEWFEEYVFTRRLPINTE